MPYSPDDDLTKRRSTVIAPAPGGTDDYFSAEIDDSGAPLNPIPVPPAVLTLLFVDFATGNPFVSTAVIIENLNPAGGNDIWVSFAGGLPGSFHRIQPQRGIAYDAKGAAGVVILDGNLGGGSTYNLHAWG